MLISIFLVCVCVSILLSCYNLDKSKINIHILYINYNANLTTRNKFIQQQTLSFLCTHFFFYFFAKPFRSICPPPTPPKHPHIRHTSSSSSSKSAPYPFLLILLRFQPRLFDGSSFHTFIVSFTTVVGVMNITEMYETVHWRTSYLY